MKQKKIEIKSLMFSFLASLSIIIIGLYTYKVTNIQIVFLDFFFTFIALLSSLIAIFITNISKIKTHILL